MADRARIFVRQDHQDNDDAVLLNIAKDAVVSEVLQAAHPLLWAKGEGPPVGSLQLRVDGKAPPLKNRVRIGECGVDFGEDTLVVELREGATPATSYAGSTAAATPPRQRSVKLSPEHHVATFSPQTPRSELLHDYNTTSSAAYATPPSQKTRPGGYACVTTPRSGRNVSVAKAKTQIDNINPASAGVVCFGSPDDHDTTTGATKGRGVGYFSPHGFDGDGAAAPYSPSPTHGGENRAGRAGGDVDMAAGSGKQISFAGYEARIGSSGADFNRLAFGEAEGRASPLNTSTRRPANSYSLTHQQSPCEDEYAYCGQRRHSPDVSSLKAGPAPSVASAVRVRSASRGRGGTGDDGRQGGSGGSVAALASGKSTHAKDPAEGRRSVGTPRPAFDSSLPTQLSGGPLTPAGTRRDDGLTLLSGSVFSQVDPPRVRRVQHMEDSGWWGHEGGYGAHPSSRRAYGAQVAQGGGGGDILNGMSPCPQSPSPSRHISRETEVGSPAGGGLTAHSAQPPSMCGKKHISKPDEHLHHNMTCEGTGWSGGLRITNAQQGRQSDGADAGQGGCGLGAGLRHKFRESQVPLGGEGIFRPGASIPRDSAARMREQDTYKSSVGGLMMREDVVSAAPEDTIEDWMKRKGRPQDGGFHALEAPAVAPHTALEFKTALMDKVGAGGASSTVRHGGELQAAWRQVSQHSGVLSKSAFCAAVAKELRIDVGPELVDQVLGYETETIAFRDFCALCTEATPAYYATPAKELTGLKAFKATRQTRAPYGTDADAVPTPPKTKSIRRTF